MIKLIENKGFFSNEIYNLTPKECFEICQNEGAILDVREEFMSSFKTFDVPEVIYCPASTLEVSCSDLPQNKLLILADATGLHSKEVYILLNKKGFNNIANMAGGLVEWERDNLPLKIDKSQRLSGSCVCQLKPRE